MPAEHNPPRKPTNKFYAIVASDKPLGVAPGPVNSQFGAPSTIQIQGSYNF